MKDVLCLPSVVCSKLLDMKGEIVYIDLYMLFILMTSEWVLVKPDSWWFNRSLSGNFSKLR